MANGGVSDKVKILKEATFADGGTAGEKVFGCTQKFEWKIETSTNQNYALEVEGPSASNNTDGVQLVSGTHEWLFTDGRELEAITGTFSQGSGTFTLDVTNALPSYSVQVVDESSADTYLKIIGLKYTKFSIQLARGDEPIKIIADWFAKDVQSSGTFTPTSPTVEPLVYLDGAYGLGTGTYQTEVEDITLEIDRAIQPRRFIEQTASGSRRLISALIEGPLSITFNGNMTAQREVLEELWGGSSMTDVRSDKNMFLKMERGTTALVLTVTGGRHVSGGRILEKTQEVALMDFAGVGLDISGTGTFPT